MSLSTNQAYAGLAALTAVSLVLLKSYVSIVASRLVGPHSPDEVATDEEIASSKESFKKIDMLNAIPRERSGEGYAVIGGSGFLASYIVRLLILRGEPNIRIIDLNSPPASVASHASVTFVKADITSLPSLRSALLAPFPSTGKPPSVIYHSAIIIRFWERLNYCKNASWPVNVDGTRNILQVVNELPGEPILVYTSTAELCTPAPDSYFSLHGKSSAQELKRKSVQQLSDEDPQWPTKGRRWYYRTKLAAEQLVIEADKASTKVKHGIIRPGYVIMGVNDLFVAATIKRGTTPVFDSTWAGSSITAWDAAASHLLMEDALRNRPQEVRGSPFLVTGKTEPWSYGKIRNTVKKISKKPINLNPVPPATMLLLAYGVEILLYLRYYFLQGVYTGLGLKKRPSVTPKWVGQLVFLQPATLMYFIEFKLDDTRARKLLGYRPQWSTVECVHHVVDAMESEENGAADK